VSDKNENRPIIIKKRPAAHHGHHGGAWKVAYADFVTAMMAFFMVMWIMGMDPQSKDMIQGYFQNPVGFTKGFGAGQNPLSAGNAMQHTGVRAVAIAMRQQQHASFNEAADKIRVRLSEDSQLGGLHDNFEITVTNVGLRIEVIDAGRGDMFFELGSTAAKPALERALRLIAGELAPLPNGVVLEGHTDARPYGSSGYSNWELSTERANIARRLLVNAGVAPERIHEVRGYADRELRNVARPHDSSNRRVSILLPFDEPPPPTATALPEPVVQRPGLPTVAP
jgi:chemotaxis protein MotB